MTLQPGFSPEKIREIAGKSQRKWSFFFIDGNHNPGMRKAGAEGEDEERGGRGGRGSRDKFFLDTSRY